MSRPKSQRPPGPDATLEELQGWLSREQQRVRDRANHARETGLDRQREEQHAALLEQFGVHADETRQRFDAGGFAEIVKMAEDPEYVHVKRYEYGADGKLRQGVGTNTTRDSS